MAFKRKHPDELRALSAALFRETSIPLTEIARMAGVSEPTANRWMDKVEAPHRRNGHGVVPKDELAILRAANHSLEDALEKAWTKLAALDRDPFAYEEILKSCKMEMATRIHHPLTKLSEVVQVVKAIHDMMANDAGKPVDSRPEWLDELKGIQLSLQELERPDPGTLTDHDKGLIVDDARAALNDSQ